jgi:hypothetical protein
VSYTNHGDDYVKDHRICASAVDDVAWLCVRRTGNAGLCARAPGLIVLRAFD